MHVLIRLRRRSAAVAVVTGGLLAMLASAAVAADAPRRPPASPAPAASTPTPVIPRKTREELVREWDINSDGKIDIGEAEVAASRMRLERANIWINTGIDPITGRPRGEPEPEDEPAEEDSDTDDPFDAADDDTPTPPKKPAGRTTTSGTQPPSNNAARLPQQRPMPLSGGVRAGAQAARAGYGTAAPQSLNAGIPIPRPQPLNGRGSQETPSNLNAGRPLNAAGGGRQFGPIVPGQPGASGNGAGAAASRPRGGLLPRPPLQPQRSRDLYDPY
jgi:hypothetical protein